MNVIAQDRYGSADVLELRDVDLPTVGDRDVLVRVRAAGVNALDWHVMRGSPRWARMMIGPRRPKVQFRGVDVAGQVEAVGKDVEKLRPGDEVFGWCQAAFADHASAPEDHFALKPAGLSFEEAAAIPLAAMTASGASRCRRRPGRPVGPDRRCFGRGGLVRCPDRQGAGCGSDRRM